MPLSDPPADFTPVPILHTLPAGSVLWRVHKRKYAADTFNPVPGEGHGCGGGRFDGTPESPAAVLYAGQEAATALSETLLRGVPFGAKGHRMIRRIDVRDRRASQLVTTRDLVLIDLRGAEALSAVLQDHTLVTAGSRDQHMTRNWAAWLRKGVPDVDGMVWPSLRHPPRDTFVLYGDRCGSGSRGGSALEVDEHGHTDLDDEAGADWINHVLRRLLARIDPPRRRH